MLRIKCFFTVLLFALFLLGCVSLASPTTSAGCPLPPNGFSESDLIGTWDAIGDRGNNTIIVRENGQYQQIMNVEWQGFHYVGDWKPWRVDYDKKGIPYRHLEGFLMCAYWESMDC